MLRPPVLPNLANLTHDETLWQQILEHDLSVVTRTFAERQPGFANDAKELEVECKRFLYLAAIAPNLVFAPTKPVDEYWHQFVMFTQEYEAFCAKFNGGFVHHNPLAGPDHENLFTRTQRAIQQLFGQFKTLTWWLLPRPATSCNCTNDGKVLMPAT
jgi:hypothetical protein